MKFIVGCAAFFFLILSFIGCSPKLFPIGNFQKTPLTIDGDLSDWNRPLRFQTVGGKTEYNITNDEENIYVSIETRDAAVALKMLTNGINVYFDTESKKNKKTCLLFPLPDESSFNNQTDFSRDPSERLDKIQSLLIQASRFNVTGFQNIENGNYVIANQNKIKVGLEQALTNNGLMYEAAIPLKFIFQNFTTKKIENLSLSVGVIINAIRYAEQNLQPVNNENMRHHRGTGIIGRNLKSLENSPQSRPVSQDKNALEKDDVNWYQFRLAKNKNG